MSRSKASAALLRLKEIDKKYRVRYEETKEEELSSDNTESLLRKPVESKNNRLTSSETEGQEISKSTLSIKIPETFIEQLESQSTSNEASPSVRVSIVNKNPIADLKIKSQSVSEIEEELEDADSIPELLDEFENSSSEMAKKSSKEEIGQSKMKDGPLTMAENNISMEKKQLENYVSGLSDAHSNDYSQCSFESYSSVYESESKSASESDVHETNNSISALDTNRNDVYCNSKSIFDTRMSAEVTEKKNEEISTKFAESIQKKEEINAKFADSIQKKEEMTAKFAKSIEKKNEEISEKFKERIEKKNEEIIAKFTESIEKKNEETITKFAESMEKDSKTVTSEDIDELDEAVEELSKSGEATESSKTISTNTEDVAYTHEKLRAKRSKRKNLKIKKQTNQEEVTKDENLFDTKLPKDESKQIDSDIKNRRELREELSSSFESSNSSWKKSDNSISKRRVSKINDKVESKKEFSCSKAKILSLDKSERNRKKIKNPENGTAEKSGISSSSVSDTNSLITKSSRNRSKMTDFELADGNEKEDTGQISSSAKEDFSHQKIENNETTLFNRAYKTNHASSESLRASRRYMKKSNDYSEEAGKLPTVGDELFESRSRRISSKRKSEHRNLGLKQRDAGKGFLKTVQSSQTAEEIGEMTERKSTATIRKKKFNQNLKVYGYVKEKKRGAKTSKTWPNCRANEEMRHARKDMELERFNRRLMNLRLEQERQLMLCYMRDFEQDRERLLLWPDRFYCPGKPESAIIKPLKFQNVLKFVKPDSNPTKSCLNFPDNHLAMLKDRVEEIRQWLKNQFIFYQSCSDVAAAINAKYVAESKKALYPSPESAAAAKPIFVKPSV